ncbi:hypothetical protein L3Q82_000739 [Scortum barcoo]|uniref:Uncharacterized protein n=1 Tax=Scortum barcoo TaxID=214431 RepID=A0ACB8WD01_9TELE|nr:hypothetical protein L3Q82_000739 [Scortum barcoo]
MHKDGLEIISYEIENYHGRRYECDSDCSDFRSYLSPCNSARVESGTWVIYERPNYMDYQCVPVRRPATEDCPSVLEKFPCRELHSYMVLRGWWVFYKHPHDKYLLGRGDYRKPVDWGALCPTVQSFRRLSEKPLTVFPLAADWPRRDEEDAGL